MCGFSLIELLLVITIISVLAAVLMPRLAAASGHANVAKATAAIRNIQSMLATLDSLPSSLDGLEGRQYRDPWGRQYIYVRLAGETAIAGIGPFARPLNTDYELLSLGRDGVRGNDDIVRARDGDYVGPVIKIHSTS